MLSLGDQVKYLLGSSDSLLVKDYCRTSEHSVLVISLGRRVPTKITGMLLGSSWPG